MYERVKLLIGIRKNWGANLKPEDANHPLRCG